MHPGSPRLRTASMELILDTLANTTRISDADKQRLQSLSLEARLQVVQQSLQILHLTEFLLLVEFTEVIVPCIYCVFMGVASQLPNRQFYTNLRDLDDAALRYTIAKVLAYACLEWSRSSCSLRCCTGSCACPHSSSWRSYWRTSGSWCSPSSCSG